MMNATTNQGDNTMDAEFNTGDRVVIEPIDGMKISGTIEGVLISQSVTGSAPGTIQFKADSGEQWNVNPSYIKPHKGEEIPDIHASFKLKFLVPWQRSPLAANRPFYEV
jgi:hypothetical protein